MADSDTPALDDQPDRFAEITAIVKRRYETGEYGDTHFKMPSAMYAELRKGVVTPKPGTYPYGLLGGYSFGALMGIPIVIDDEVPEGTWRLTRNGTNEVLRDSRPCTFHEHGCSGPCVGRECYAIDGHVYEAWRDEEPAGER